MKRDKQNPVKELEITPAERQRLQRQVDREFSGRGAQLRKSASLFAKFTGDGDIKAMKLRIPDMPEAVMEIGQCDEIGYTAVRDGQVERYRHTFKKNCRPLLCASPDGKQLFLIGGSFTFGERGIVDD
jgi:hypothetical protein